MFKINDLDIKYFKFFHDTEKINFNENNVLIFGENGSGKSTIYWALYTFLQSSIKPDNEIIDYFKESTDENINEKSLVNIFESDDTKSYVKLNLKNGDIDSSYIISKEDIDTNKADKLIENSNLASDFISYKYLFRFFNFLHRDEIDLFPLFSYEILQFLSKNTDNLNDLWKEIESLSKSKPRKIADKTEYDELIEKLNTFNSYLKSIISDLNVPTRDYLKKFNHEDIKLTLDVIDGIYEKQNFTPPKISLKIIVKRPNDEIIIHRPQSYFNEAKLTAIALSVRFAVSQIKLKSSDFKVLVLDDLLVSLDMSNRSIVLNILLNDNNFKDHQLIILTHDKSFYNMAKNKFDSIPNSKWKYFEMYVNNKLNITQPLVLNHYNYFEKAEYYLVKHDYPACANYLRKEAERLLKFIKQNHLDSQITNVDEGFVDFKTLLNSAKSNNNISKYQEILSKTENLIEKRKFKDFISEEFETMPNKDEIIDYIRIEMKNFDSFKKRKIEDLRETLEVLDEFVQLLLNPLSHDTNKIPIYKKELEDTVEVLRKLNEDILGS